MQSPTDRFALEISAFFANCPVTYVCVGEADYVGVTSLMDAGLRIEQAVFADTGGDHKPRQSSNANPQTEIISIHADFADSASPASIDALIEDLPNRKLSILRIKAGTHDQTALATAQKSLSAGVIDVIYLLASLDAGEAEVSNIADLQSALSEYGYKLYKIYDQRHDTEHDRPVLQDFGAVFLSPDMIARHPLSVIEENHALRRALDDATAHNAVLTAELKRELDRRHTEIAALSEMLSAMQPVERRPRKIHLKHAQRRTPKKRGPLDLSPVWQSRRRQKLALVLIAVWLVGLLAYSYFAGA